MSGKRQRVALELPDVGPQAALPAVCYVPSMLAEGTGATASGDAPSASASASAAKRLKYSVHARRGVGSATQLVHATLGEIDYVGRSDGDENAAVQPCSYALGVFSPAEGKLRLVGVAGERLFRLDTRLQGLVYAPTGAGGEEDANARDARRLAAKRLVDEFGSTRRRRQMTAREAGVVAADRISGGAAVQEMLGGVAARGQGEGLTKEEVQRRAFEQRTVPPHDPAATSPTAAYPLALLLGPNRSGAGGSVADVLAARASGSALTAELDSRQLEKLTEDQEALAKAREKEFVHPYVLSRLGPLRSLKAAGSDPAAVARSKSRAQYLALLAVLLRLQSKPVVTPKEEGGSTGVARELRLRSEKLADLLLSRFYIRTDDSMHGPRYERPDALRALLLSYILAVAVVAEDGFMDGEQFEGLRAALKLDASKMAAALHQLGCSTKSIKLKVERDGRSVDVTSYTAALLRQDSRSPDAKTLAQCFPVLRLTKAKAGGKK